MANYHDEYRELQIENDLLKAEKNVLQQDFEQLNYDFKCLKEALFTACVNEFEGLQRSDEIRDWTASGIYNHGYGILINLIEDIGAGKEYLDFNINMS